MIKFFMKNSCLTRSLNLSILFQDIIVQHYNLDQRTLNDAAKYYLALESKLPSQNG